MNDDLNILIEYYNKHTKDFLKIAVKIKEGYTYFNDYKYFKEKDIEPKWEKIIKKLLPYDDIENLIILDISDISDIQTFEEIKDV